MHWPSSIRLAASPAMRTATMPNVFATIRGCVRLPAGKRRVDFVVTDLFFPPTTSSLPTTGTGHAGGRSNRASARSGEYRVTQDIHGQVALDHRSFCPRRRQPFKPPFYLAGGRGKRENSCQIGSQPRIRFVKQNRESLDGLLA
jgi:hypothetical protein